MPEEEGMQEVTWKVTVAEANLILEGIGTLPFARIYHLVAKLQRQASEQLQDTEGAAEPVAR
jgi:hypothetical protein